MEKYVKVKQIGEGSFGKAILMKRKDNGAMCVIKEIGISRMSPKERAASKKEVKVLSQLQHPNIVAYQESFEGKGNLYIVMDYCEKGDLHQYITSRRSVYIEESKILDIFTQCCLAIKYVHDRKILHRDIKTQNIFLTKDNMVKLGDFGIARVLKNTMELAHTCIGTPYYLSPEIVENRPYNNKSDIWSLGCVLYEMATLKHAFEAGNMKNLVMKIVRGSYPPIPSKYSYELRALVAQTFKRSPSDRPSINSILKKPFIQKIVAKLEPVVSETDSEVLPKPKPSSSPVAKPPVAKVEPSRKNIAAKRCMEIASAYGISIAKKPVPNKKPNVNPVNKPKNVVAGNAKLSNENIKEARERRRRNFAGDDQKYQQQMNKVQQDRWEKQKIGQMKVARDAGWKNVLGVADEDNKDNNVDKNVKLHEKEDVKKKQLKDEPSGRNVSKDQQRVMPIKRDENISKEHAEQKPDRCVKQVNALEAAPKAAVNVLQGNLNCDRAKLLEDYWQRKKEAEANRNRAYRDLYGNVNSKPPMPSNKEQVVLKGKVQPAYAAARNNQENDYLKQLEAIRRQNFIERRSINQRSGVEENKKGDPRYDPDARKQKLEELKKQGQKGFMIQQQNEPIKPVKQPIQKSEKGLPRNKNLVGNNNCKIIMSKQQNNVWNEQQNVSDGHRKNVWDDKQVDAGNIQKPEVQKQEIVTPPVGIATVMREVKQNLTRSCSEGDIQEALKQVVVPPRRAWGAANCGPLELGRMPMEITSSAMESTTENDGEHPDDKSHVVAPSSHKVCKPLGPDGKQQFPTNDEAENKNTNKNEEKMRKFWIHDGKTQFVANLGMKDISGTVMPTYTIDRDLTDDNYFKHVPTIEPFKNNTITISQELNKCEGTYKVENKETNTAEISPVNADKSSDNNIQELPGDSSNRDIGDKANMLPKDPEINTGRTESSSQECSLFQTVVSQAGDNRSEESVGDKDVTKLVSSLSEEDVIELAGVKTSVSNEVLKKESEVNPLQDVVSEVVCERLGALDETPEERLSLKAPLLEAWSEVSHIKTEAWSEESHIKTTEISNLDEDEFHTPSRGFGLESGFYDTEKKLLRTCSLPDLKSLVIPPEPVDSLEVSDIDEYFISELVEESIVGKENVVVNKDTADDNTVFKHIIKDTGEETVPHNIIECLEGNDERCEDDNFGEIIEIEDIDDESVDEEEISDYASILESMSDLISSTDYTNNSDLSDTNEEDSVDWESDEDEGEEKTISTKKSKEKDDLFSRIEESRKKLEDELGLERFMKVYKHLQMIQEHEDDELEIGTAELSVLLGDKEHLYQKILYLVMADSAYCEGNDGVE